MTSGRTQPGQAPQLDLFDFTINIYRGCVLPEDYRPVRTVLWSVWTKANPDDYSPAQLEVIRTKLLTGGSWVCFCSSLETVSAPDYYKAKTPYFNPVHPKERVL